VIKSKIKEGLPAHSRADNPDKDKRLNITNQIHTIQSSPKSIDRQAKIAKRLAVMPRKYRAVYRRAVTNQLTKNLQKILTLIVTARH